MLAIVNRNIASGLRKHFTGIILEFSAGGSTDPDLRNHPSRFICQTPSELVLSPEVPSSFAEQLSFYKIKFKQGSRYLEPGTRYPSIPCYNAVATDKYLIHRLELTDPIIVQSCHFLKKIPVKQGFTRSHLLPLKNDHFITSDPGIEKALREKGLDVLFVSPREIVLPGHENGGIGGAGGVMDDVVFFHGSLEYHPDGEKIRNYLLALGFRITELSRTPLTDSGSLLFLRMEN